MDDTSKRKQELADLEAFGVDMTLVREMVRLTPDERLAWHRRMLAMVKALRDARPRIG